MNMHSNEPIRQFHANNTIPPKGWVFCFGSNEAGRHGKGAPAIAHVNFRAHYGVGRGATGMAYAIPTKDKNLRALSIESIEASVEVFLAYARENSAVKFFVTRLGYDLGSEIDEKIALMFSTAPLNCSMPEGWERFMQDAEQTAVV